MRKIGKSEKEAEREGGESIRDVDVEGLRGYCRIEEESERYLRGLLLFLSLSHSLSMSPSVFLSVSLSLAFSLSLSRFLSLYLSIYLSISMSTSALFITTNAIILFRI